MYIWQNVSRSLRHCGGHSINYSVYFCRCFNCSAGEPRSTNNPNRCHLIDFWNTAAEYFSWLSLAFRWRGDWHPWKLKLYCPNPDTHVRCTRSNIYCCWGAASRHGWRAASLELAGSKPAGFANHLFPGRFYRYIWWNFGMCSVALVSIMKKIVMYNIIACGYGIMRIIN